MDIFYFCLHILFLAFVMKPAKLFVSLPVQRCSMQVLKRKHLEALCWN